MKICNRFTGELILEVDDPAEIKQSGVSLFGADLGGVNLHGADLSGVDIRNANLGGAKLRDADLSKADLRWADLRNASLRYADLRNAKLRDADLSKADLRYANLRGADLPANFFYLRADPYDIFGTAECVWIGCEKLEVTDNLRAAILRLKEKHEITDATADRLIPLIESLINSVKGK